MSPYFYSLTTILSMSVSPEDPIQFYIGTLKLACDIANEENQ